MVVRVLETLLLPCRVLLGAPALPKILQAYEQGLAGAGAGRAAQAALATLRGLAETADPVGPQQYAGLLKSSLAGAAVAVKGLTEKIKVPLAALGEVVEVAMVERLGTSRGVVPLPLRAQQTQAAVAEVVQLADSQGVLGL